MRSKQHTGLLIAGMFLFLHSFLYSADRYWIATTTSNWNTTASWSTTSGGASGASVPGSGDIAIFNSSKVGSCTINAAVNVAGFDVRTGYTGTISQGANTITIGTSNAIFTAGTFSGGSSAITCNGTFTLSGTSFTSTSNTLTFNSTVTNSSGTFTHNSGTVTFNSSSSQTIPAWDFYNLTSSSSGARTLASSGTIGIAATFTKGTNTYTATGSTIDYKGTGAQTIVAFNYNNLTSSSSGARTLASSGTVGIAGTFTKGTNAYTITSSTINYNGTGAQTITAFGYNNLTLSGARTTNSVTLASSDTIKVATTFTASATFTSGAYIISGSTLTYNGTGAQTLTAFNYNNLRFTGARGANNITFATSGVIGIAGAFTSSATFSGGYGYVTTSSTVNYNGTGAQSIPTIEYYNLTISGTRSGDVTIGNADTLSINKIFLPATTFTSGSYSAGTSTIEFKGTLFQTIPAFTYNNLVSSSSGGRAFSSTGTVKITGIFTKGSNTYYNYGSTGEGFTPKYTGVTDVFYATAAVDASNAFIAGNAGRILKTTDAGVIWGAQTSNTTTDLFAISFWDTNNGIAVGNSGVITKTSNGGSTWSTVTSGTGQHLRSIYYSTSSVVFAGGASSTIRKSTDGGATWGSTTVPGGISGIYGITFTSSTDGYAVGWAGAIIKTTDSGNNWSSLTSGVSDALASVKFISSTTGFAVGANGRILKTTDSGANWSTVTSGTSEQLSSIHFLDSNNGYIIGGHITNNTGIILKTTDGGTTWSIIYSGTARLSGMSIFNQEVGYIVAVEGTAVKYTCCTDGSTVEFASTNSQTIPALDYNNLVFSSTGSRTLASSGNIGISRNFTRHTNQLTVTGSTIVVNGSMKQTFSGYSVLNNLTIAGTSSNDTLYNGTADSILVNGTFTYQGTNGVAFTNGKIRIAGDATLSNSGTTGFGGTGTIVFAGANTQAIASSSAIGAGALPNVEINKTSNTLTFTGDLSVQGDWTYTKGTCVSNGSLNLLGTYNLDGQGTSSTMTFKDLTIYSGTRTLTGNLLMSGILKINSGATFTPGAYPISLAGTYENNGTFNTGTSVITFNGTGLQFIKKSSGTETFKSLVINKATGKVQLNAPVSIVDSVRFVEGIIRATATNYLQFIDNAVAKNASDSSYVDGPVIKIGNDTFLFPLGDTTLLTGAYHPLGISAPSVATDAYTGEYFATGQAFGSTLQADSLENLSTCEYWDLTRTVGSSVVAPTISWNSNMCNMSNYSDLRVARWDGTASEWKTMGNAGGTFDRSMGTLKTPVGFGTAVLHLGFASKPAKPNPYFILKRALDAGCYVVDKGTIKFKFDEEYNDTDNLLQFTIYNNQTHSIKTNNFLVPTPLSSDFGERWYSINLWDCAVSPTGLLANGFYILEVQNEKKEKWYLRFEQQSLGSISCTGATLGTFTP